MLPFSVVLTTGESPYRQIVYAATRAIVSGELPAGEPFPSVRDLSQALKINPNTAHKVVSELIRSDLLDVLPGVGTVVSSERHVSVEERSRLLSTEVEQLVVEAMRLGLKKDEVLEAVAQRWSELSRRSRGQPATQGATMTTAVKE